MDENLRAQIDTYLPHIDGLIRRGVELREILETDPSDNSALAAYRVWQQDIGLTINQLSGASKAHWLARAFSEAFLVRSTTAHVVDAVAPAEIITRLVGVLEQAVTSLGRLGAGLATAATPEAAPPPRRFEFVHSRELRPVVEQAFIDSRQALDEGNFGLALVNACGILEAIVTDALEHKGLNSLGGDGIPAGKIVDWPFETRLAVAESAGLIRGGCARLPDVARHYRELTGSDGTPPANISERDARRTMQVLHVVMRDLDPGR
jgi:hypothetical protein